MLLLGNLNSFGEDRRLGGTFLSPWQAIDLDLVVPVQRLVLTGVLVGDIEVALEDRKLPLIDLNFVVVIGQSRRLLGAVSAAEKLTLHMQRSTFLV